MADRILAVITARGGSKGIPHKNKRVFAGKPLLWYTIDAAKKSKYLTKIVFSTDDDEMLAIARQEGIIPLKRPAELATDTATSLDVLKHAVRHFEEEGFKPDLIVTLQPVSPMRTAQDIDSCVELQRKHDADSVVTVCESEPHPRWLFKIVRKDGEDLLVPWMEGDYYATTRRQDFEQVYKLNGAFVYVSTYDLLMRQNKILGGKLIPHVMEPWLSFDLDHPADWAVGELIFLNQEKIRADIRRIEEEKARLRQ